MTKPVMKIGSRSLPLGLLAPLLAPLLWACGGDAQEHPPIGRGVLLIAVDAWRFDHTSFAGYDRDTTPSLSAFAAQEAVVFTDAWSPAPLLVPAHAGLLTGCAPTVSRNPTVVLSDGTRLAPLTKWFLPRDVPSLAEEYQAAGWRTAAFVDHASIDALQGFDRGFRDFVPVGGERRRAPGPRGLGGVAKRFIRWVKSLDAEEDWFAYVHLNDLEVLWNEERWLRDRGPLEPAFEPRPELDHVPPVGFRSPIFHALPPRHALQGQPSLGEYEVRYDRAIRWLDHHLVRIPPHLDAEGRLERTTLVLVGTYGLGFGESGFVVDSGSLSDVDLHVPLLIRPAPELGLEVGRTCESLVGTVDVARTLLELSGLPVPAGMLGGSASLVPLLRGETETVRTEVFASNGHADGFCVVDERWMYSLSRPGTRGVLSSSWFGDTREHRRDEVEVLVERGPGTPPGTLGLGVVDRAAASALRTVGEERLELLMRWREVVHPSPWNVDKRGPAVVEELRARGLIGDP